MNETTARILEKLRTEFPDHSIEFELSEQPVLRGDAPDKRADFYKIKIDGHSTSLVMDERRHLDVEMQVFFDSRGGFSEFLEEIAVDAVRYYLSKTARAQRRDQVPKIAQNTSNLKPI